MITVIVTLDTGETYRGEGDRPWDAVVNALWRNGYEDIVFGIDWDDKAENKWTATAGNFGRIDGGNDGGAKPAGRWVRVSE